MAAVVRSRAEAIDYDAFRFPPLLLAAWVSERRQDRAGASRGVPAGAELGGRIGFDDHAAFALARQASLALAGGELRGAEELARQALATAEAAGAPWPAALARVQLARCAAAAGDADTADQLYRDVLDWSEAQRPHQARESLFIALAGAR